MFREKLPAASEPEGDVTASELPKPAAVCKERLGLLGPGALLGSYIRLLYRASLLLFSEYCYYYSYLVVVPMIIITITSIVVVIIIVTVVIILLGIIISLYIHTYIHTYIYIYICIHRYVIIYV